jgi:hypothetical protein
MGNLQQSDWERLLQEARSETDTGKLREKLEAAEVALFTRAQELFESREGHEESAAIRRASDELLQIKTERLKWPAPFTGELPN